MSFGKLLVSVIIPTYHDWERANKCLNALHQQSLNAIDYEVIIVNNDPEDAPPSRVYLTDGVKLVNEAAPGSYAARNAGLKTAQGQILAFTDSDCLPHTDWLKHAISAILAGEVDRVAGRVDVFSNQKKMTATECYESIFAFNQKNNVSNGVAVTANLLVKADLFEKVGFFDERLFSGGDIEWNRRATEMGYTIKYLENAIVSHPARHTWSEMASKLRRTMGGKLFSNPEYKVKMFRSFFPPLEALSQIARHDPASFRTKVLAFCIAYRIKVFRYFYFRKLKTGRCAVERT